MDTDQEIFAHAIADEPPAEQNEQQPASPSEPAGDTGPARDEHGRFTTKQDEPVKPEEPAAPEPPPPQKPPEQDHRVPLVELLNEREKRQTFEREIAEERRQREALQRQLAELQRKSEPPQPSPDIFENPQGFVESVEQRIERKLYEQNINFDLRLAHSKYGPEFEAAYEAAAKAGQSGAGAEIQAILGSPSPGEALIRWHRQRSLMDKTGGDLDAYLQKREAELLDNPEFLKKVADKLRSQQSGQPAGQRAAPVVDLPPSLSRVPSAAPTTDDPVDTSSAGMFRHALGR